MPLRTNVAATMMFAVHRHRRIQAIGQSVLWAMPLPISLPYFAYSARREERQMAERFPLQYPAYRKRTNMLIPFIL